jgi:hypothetical protein
MSEAICVIVRVYVRTFEVCQQSFVLSRFYVMKLDVAPDIPQASLHKHETAQITSHIP